LYEKIFADGLVPDREALERRMSLTPEKRSEGAAKVAEELEKMEREGARRLNEARILILGAKGAGKTCIARRLIDPNAPMTTGPKESTAGVDTTLWKLEEEGINVHIWDFAGHTITHAAHRFFLSERCLYIVVCDGRTEEKPAYWLDHMRTYGKDAQAFILLNKQDQHTPEIQLNTLKEQYAIAGVHTFSIQDDKDELERFRQTVADYIKNNPSWNKQQIPATSFDVKEALEGLFMRGDASRNKEYITMDDFNKIAAKCKATHTDGLLKDLHDLGICLWYGDMQGYQTLVLNPEWISHGVYKIINWVHEHKGYAISPTEFKEVFKGDSRYQEKQFPFIADLMEHYEIAYKCQPEGRLIIPHLLKKDRPDVLPDFPVGESLMLRYKVDMSLPTYTIFRFIVRHNKEIKREGAEDLLWYKGVVLEDGKGSIALIREIDRTISVSVKGTDKTAFLDRLRATLNYIFNSYKSKMPELEYRIEAYGEIQDKMPSYEQPELWLPDSKIFNHALVNEPYYEDKTRIRIPLNQTVYNYNINAKNLLSGSGAMLDQSRHTTNNTFNFYDCNINLQGHLSDLAVSLRRNGNVVEADDLEAAKEALEKAESSQTPAEVKKSGVLNKLKRILQDLGDENSTLCKKIKGIKHGVEIAKEIVNAGYEIFKCCGESFGSPPTL
jgi:GTPase SAR1 family protein